MRIIIIIALTLSLTACAFHPRNAEDIPLQLKTIYLNTDNPYSEFTTQLKNMLQSLDIKLAKSRFRAPYQIRIKHYKFTQSHPALTTTMLAVTFTYSLRLNLSIYNKAGKSIIGPLKLSTSRTVVQNASQVYTPGTATLAKQELRRDLISRIYYVLISEEVKKALYEHHTR